MRKLIYTDSKIPVRLGDKHRSCTWLVEVAAINPETGVIRMRHLQGFHHEYDERYPSNFGAEWVEVSNEEIAAYLDACEVTDAALN